MDEVKTREEVPFVIALAALLAGGSAKVKTSGMYSAAYCTISPLTHDRSMLEATMDLSRWHAPVLIYPTPASGTTGPPSLFSNVAMAVAEALSSLVLFQSHSPGCPLIMGAAMGAVDGRTGAFSYGMAETALQLLAMREMCAWYQMPSFIAGATTDAMAPGIQSTFEKMLTAMPLVLGDAGMINGFGLLECGLTLSLEQMILDGQMALALKGFSAWEEGEQSKGCVWLGRGDEDPLWRAHREVQIILSREQRLPMNETMIREMDGILEEATAKLGRPDD
jgi:trimethylamine:corrinoid methyltransferase-like protein